MSTHKHIDRICCVAIALALLLTVLFMNGTALGLQAADNALGYEDRLFDTSVVHTIDIVMDDWEDFLEGCTDEEYVLCDLDIDGESYQNVAIRAKGNTSLTQVASYGNDRYSFKIEFDHYDSSITYHGLDKLSLNNIIQDDTYMKDYLTYQMMGWFGVDAPLCSYVYITVNGEDWGLYLAVEGVEDAFLERNYGSDHGELYKPDSQSMGGGRGNGGAFDLEDWMADQEDGGTDQTFDREAAGQEQLGAMTPPGMEAMELSDGEASEAPPEERSDRTASAGSETTDSVAAEDGVSDEEEESSSGFRETGGRQFGGGMGGMGSMGSSDVSLVYTDDDYDSYSNIFDNAKTDITDADKDRLIAALKQLNEGENIESVVDVDEVIRYFVVHNFVCNFDSYTGSMIHNYYLYEEDGQLSMIPWDYNLAFGGFQGSEDATALVNYPIDTPVSGGTVDSRPMLAWIFADEEYTELYHQYFDQFITGYFESGYFTLMMAETKALIAPYVEKDPTKFCTYEEFETGIDTLEQFCLLRAESVRGQLEGTIPSTEEGQNQDASTLVDASAITISDMGSMNNGGMGGMDRGNGVAFGRGQAGGGSASPENDITAETADGSQTPPDGDAPATEAGQSAPAGAETQADPNDPVQAFAGDGQTAPDQSDSTEADPGLPEEAGEAGLSATGPAGDAWAERLTDRSGETAAPAGIPGQAGADSQEALLLLAASGAVLLAGLVAAVLYRKRA